MKHTYFPALALLAILVRSQCLAQDSATRKSGEVHPMTMDEAQKLFSGLVGTWKGTSRTWFQPGKLGDESAVQGTITRILHGGFLRHEYSGEMKGKARKGDETIMFNPVKTRFEVSWIDSFHMSYGIMFSVGEPSEKGFTVLGSYDVAPNSPPWGWKTVYQVIDEDHIKLTAFNITPDGKEAKATEIEYSRVAE